MGSSDKSITQSVEQNHPFPIHSYCTVYNVYHSRHGDTGRIIAFQRSHRSPNNPYEYELEFSDSKRFWFAGESIECIRRAREPMIPGEPE